MESIGNQVIELLMSHTSVREYDRRPVPQELVEELVACGQMAPTSSYLQAYTIIQVKDDEKRRFLRTCSGDQAWVEEAPAALLFCADLNRIRKLACPEDEGILHNGEAFTVAVVDAALAAQKTLIAAQARGLGGVVVGGIRNEAERVTELFGLPELVYPMFLLCLGYPRRSEAEEAADAAGKAGSAGSAGSAGTKPRLPQPLVLGEDGYPDLDSEEARCLLDGYEKEASAYFERLTAGRSRRGWAARARFALENKPRHEVSGYLRSRGFFTK